MDLLQLHGAWYSDEHAPTTVDQVDRNCDIVESGEFRVDMAALHDELPTQSRTG